MAVIWMTLGFWSGSVVANEGSLLQRIEALEQRVLKLEQNNGSWKDPVLWLRLKKEMSKADVEKIIGKPQRIENSIFTTWYYHPTAKTHSFVWFDDNKLLGWEGYE